MDGSNKPCFQSVVILGLKTALLEAQDEINRLTRERDEVRKKILQMIQTNGKFQVEVIKSNELATKLKTELKKVRKELEDYKIKLNDVREENEREHVNWTFKYNELKSLLDIKTELLESLNIKGDRTSKDESFDYRANYKILMKNLKIVIKNRLRFPDKELLQDIGNMVLKMERGKSLILSKYLAKKMKSTKQKSDEWYDNDVEKKTTEILENSNDQISTSTSLSSCNKKYNCSEKLDPSTIQHNSFTNVEDFCNPNNNANISTNTNIDREKTIEIYDKRQNKLCDSVISLDQNDEKDIDTNSDSESDSTSGFCDGETEVESPSNTELVNHSRSTLSPENHTFAMCMPDLLSSSHIQKNTPTSECCKKKDVDDSITNFELSNPILSSKLRNDKSPSPQKKKPSLHVTREVQSILKEMNQMKSAMIDKIASLKQFHDDDSIEMNNCFKRPNSVPSPFRKLAKTDRKIIEDTSDFISKRSSQLVKRNSWHRKLNCSAVSSAILEASDTEPSMKLDLELNKESETLEDSSKKLNFASETLDLNIAKNLEICKTSSVENSSLLSNVTSCFKKPVETATEFQTQLFIETGIHDTIDLKDTSNEIRAVEEIGNIQVSVLPNSVSESSHSTDIQPPKILENSNMNTLTTIDPIVNLCELAKQSRVETSLNIIPEVKNETASKEFMDGVSSEKSSFSINENLNEVSTKQNSETANQFTDIPPSGTEISNEKLISTENSINQNSVNSSFEFFNVENKNMEKINFDFIHETSTRTTLQNSKSPFKTAKLKHISFSGEKNDSTENATNSLDEDAILKTMSLSVRKPVDKLQGISDSVTVSDVDLDSRLAVSTETTTDRGDPLNASGITQKCVESAFAKSKTEVIVSSKLVPENNVHINSFTNSNTSEEKVVEKTVRKRGRPKKASSNSRIESNPPKTTDIAEQQENLSTSTPKINIVISENLNKSCISERDIKTNSLIESNFTVEKISEEAPKRRGRPRKLNSDTSRLKKKSVISKTSNESSDPENNCKRNAVIDSDSTERIKIENARNKRRCGRTKKASLVTKSEPQNSSSSAEPKPNNFETTRLTRRRCTINSCKNEQIADNVKLSCTVSNGMEQRKRKGKYPDILESLRSNSKRRKSAYDFKSLEADKDEKPKQSRGCKRKASLPVQTSDSATQTNWSLRSKSVISENTNDIPEVETSAETRHEPVLSSVEISPQNIKNNRQINEQPLPDKINIDKSIEVGTPKIPTNFESSNIVTLAESCTNPANCSLPSSCHHVTSSRHNLLHQLINDMSKMIREKVSSIVLDRAVVFEHENSEDVESRLDVIEKSNCDDTCSFKEKIISNGSLETTNQPKTTPTAIKPHFVHHSSTRLSNNLESGAKFDTSTTNELQAAIPVAKSKEEYFSGLQNSSKEPENNEETIPKPMVNTTSQTEVTAVEKLQTELVSNSLNSSSKTKNDVTTSIQLETISSVELQQKQNPSLSNSSSENDENSVSKPSMQIANKLQNFSFEVSNEESNQKNDESRTKLSMRAESPNEKLKSNLSPKLQSDEESITKWSIPTTNSTEDTPVAKLEQKNVDSSTSKTESNQQSYAKSIFDFGDAKSPLKISREVSPLTQEVSTECKQVDSDDDTPVEISSKMVFPARGIRRDLDTCRHVPRTTTKIRYEEEVSNSSSLSSQVSELDVNSELVSKFENIRTPPKVKNLFDLSDDENSKSDAFSIIEEMACVSRCMLQRQKELAEFSRSSSTFFESKVIPSSEKCPLYSPSQNKSADDMPIKDEDDSEDETLIIAEDDHQVSDSTVDGIEINKFNFRDLNDEYASPAYTKSLTPSCLEYGQLSNRIVNQSRIKLDNNVIEPRPKINGEIENQNKTSNPVRFQFYKENVQIENDGGTSKALSPFESIWDTLKSLYVRSPPLGEDVFLIPCYQSVTHLAFFYTKRKTDSQREYCSVEEDKITYIEELIGKYLENVRENEYVAVKKFKLSADANPFTISTALNNMVLNNSNRHMKELKRTLGYLSNLCVDLETDHKDFLSIMQTTLKDKMFSKSWQIEKNSDTNQVTCIIAMSVLFTMLSQRSNDVKSVKDLLLEGLCLWKYRAHPVAFGVLNACPTIFNDASRNCLLTRVILFALINHSMERNLELYKVPEVRDMISQRYKVKLGDKAAEDYVKEAMLLYNDDTWVDAMVLLCKRKQFPWAYTNVIMKYLVQIVNKWKECDFNEMILIKTVQALHKIVQSCPLKAVNNLNKTKGRQATVPKYQTYNITSIINTLSEVLHCSKGSRELRETVAIALCNISHLNFEICSTILSKWQPPEGAISNQTLEEMNKIMKRCRMVAPNVPNRWLKVLLPKDSMPKRYNNKRNFAPRTFERANSDSFSQQQNQRQLPSRFRVKNSVASEPLKKKKKKNKQKGKKNQNDREENTKAET